MENVTDALKMAAAILIFIGALSVAVLTLSRAKQASESLIKTSDVFTYATQDANGKNYKFTSVREVGIDEVISNMYSYYQNYNTILFYTGSYNESTGEVYGLRPVPLYSSDAMDYSYAGTAPLDKSILRINNSKQIFGLDINDERSRQEPWANDLRYYKLFIDSLINNVNPDVGNGEKNGVKVQWYNWSRVRTRVGSSWVDMSTISQNKIDPATHKIAMRFTYATPMNISSFAEAYNGKFIERVGRYNYKVMQESNAESSSSSVSSTQSTAKSSDGILGSSSSAQIKFDNGESIDNQNGTETSKMVIQYIYIGN